MVDWALKTTFLPSLCGYFMQGYSHKRDKFTNFIQHKKVQMNAYLF